MCLLSLVTDFIPWCMSLWKHDIVCSFTLCNAVPVSYRFLKNIFLHTIRGPVCCTQRWWQLQERLLCPCRWKVIESDGQRRVWTTWQTKSDRLANKEGYKWLPSDGSWRILSAVVTVEAAAILALVSRSFLSLNCRRQIEETWVCTVRKGKR